MARDQDVAPDFAADDFWSEELGELNTHQVHFSIGNFVSNLRAALNTSVVALAAYDSIRRVADRKVQFPSKARQNSSRNAA